jgi:hypothetical protein
VQGSQEPKEESITFRNHSPEPAPIQPAVKSEDLKARVMSLRKTLLSGGSVDIECMGQLLMSLIVGECQKNKTPLKQIRSIIESRNDKMNASQLRGIIKVLGKSKMDEE